jgi:hypothetical protein
MSNALLDKARAILAHPKQGPPPSTTLEAEDKKVPMTEPRVSTFTPGETIPSNASPTPSAPPPKGIQIEPAPLDARAIYWETGTGRILGPAIPEFLARDGDSFWISSTFEQAIWWINADRLRSKKAFSEQREIKEVELIRSF